MIKLPKGLLTIFLHPEVDGSPAGLDSAPPEYQNRKLAAKLRSAI
jgi:hypothetical protein